ncbi:hypothetical protein ABZ897_55305 [Nonomuraea sp. NPDC046802]|uniref:hypothetical protein n=1 Tax=Nonomuraea sp. NPDC046802 TaxID=3154919 RepID=UPI0033F8C8D9
MSHALYSVRPQTEPHTASPTNALNDDGAVLLLTGSPDMRNCPAFLAGQGPSRQARDSQRLIQAIHHACSVPFEHSKTGVSA